MKLYLKLTHSLLKLLALAMILSLVFTIGCTTTKTKYSGFLNDYSKLQADPMDKDNSMFWVDTMATLNKYNKFIIEPISIHFSPEIQDQAKNVDTKVLNDITNYFQTAITKSLSKDFSIVNQPGHDVARLRIGLTTINVDRKDLKFYNYIPVSMVLVGIGEATGVRDRVAVLTMEGEALDSISGKRVAASVQRKSNEVSVKTPEDLSAKDVYPTLDFWANKMKDRLLNNR